MVVINTVDPDRLAAFWTGVARGRNRPSLGPYFIWLEPQHDGGAPVAFQEVDDSTEGRRRLHLDTYVEDLDTSVKRALDLGATQVEEHTSGYFSDRPLPIRTATNSASHPALEDRRAGQ